MEVIVAFAAWGLRAICSQAGMSGGLCPTIPNASADLGPLLSKQAHIYLPGSNEFGEKSTRWQEYNKPDITTVVEVASENDVVETVGQFKRSIELANH